MSESATDLPENPMLPRLLEHFAAMIRVFDLRTPEGWNIFRSEVPLLDTKNGDRMRAAFSTRAAWVLVEDNYIDRDYRDTFSHIFSKRFATPPTRCQRLHFFDNTQTSAPDLDSLGHDSVDSAYLGYAVVRPTRPNGLGRVLVKPNIALSDVQGVELSLSPEKITLFGRKLEVKGFPFIGQDTDVTTCAQATLWMLRRYYSNRYSQYAETRPYELATLAREHLRGDRAFPASGLSDWQMAEMLRGLGFSPVIYAKSKVAEFRKLLHIYLDSGVPLVLNFNRKGGAEGDAGHATACFGFRHRVPSPIKTKGDFRTYHSGSVIVNDDNYPPYLEARDSQPQNVTEIYPQAPELERLSSMIVPLPSQISLLADQFDELVRSLLAGNQWGIERRSPKLKEVKDADHLALRIYLTSCRNLKQGLRLQKTGQPLLETAYRLMPLPHFVWVCELHDLSKEWNQRCLGEIMWDATCNRHEHQGLLALHYPEVMVINSLPVFENRVAPSAQAHAGWLEIPLQGQNPVPYSPAPANLDNISLV